MMILYAMHHNANRYDIDCDLIDCDDASHGDVNNDDPNSNDGDHNLVYLTPLFSL